MTAGCFRYTRHLPSRAVSGDSGERESELARTRLGGVGLQRTRTSKNAGGFERRVIFPRRGSSSPVAQNGSSVNLFRFASSRGGQCECACQLCLLPGAAGEPRRISPRQPRLQVCAKGRELRNVSFAARPLNCRCCVTHLYDVTQLHDCAFLISGFL